MSKPASALAHYAKLGAAVRLQQLEAERAAISAAFPDLARAVHQDGAPRAPRKMSAAARAKIAAAARRRWATWRKTKQQN